MAGTAKARPATTSDLASPPLTRRLERAAAEELAAYHRSTVIRAATDDEELVPILDDIASEERRHYEALVRRVHQLGGRIPIEPAPFLESCEFTGSLDIMVCVEESIHRYSRLCSLTESSDPWTFALCQAIVWEKTEHRSWLAEFLGLPAPPSRFRQGFRGRSPYLALIGRTAHGPSPGRAD